MNILVNSLFSPIVSFIWEEVSCSSGKWGSQLPPEDILHVKNRICQSALYHKDKNYALCFSVCVCLCLFCLFCFWGFLPIAKPSWVFNDIIWSEKFTLHLSGGKKCTFKFPGSYIKVWNSHSWYSSNCFLSLAGMRIASYMIKDITLFIVVIYGNTLASTWVFPVTANLLTMSLWQIKKTSKNIEKT